MLVPFAEIGHLFQDFEHTAWRLESRRHYATDLESPRFAAFQETGRLPERPGHPWVDNVRRQLDLGKTFGRVRVVDQPLTDNQRFLLASSLESPEDIRVLPRSRAKELELPDEDVWLFDSKITARPVFDDEDRTLGVVVTEDPAEVLRICQVRDTVQSRRRALPVALCRSDTARAEPSSREPRLDFCRPGLSAVPGRIRWRSPTPEEDTMKVGDPDYNAALEDLLEILRDWATREYQPLFYSDVSEKLGNLGHDVPAHEGPLPYLLEDCTKIISPMGKEPMISALVVLKETWRPSAGFFKLARRLPYNRKGSDDEIWLEEIRLLTPRRS